MQHTVSPVFSPPIRRKRPGVNNIMSSLCAACFLSCRYDLRGGGDLRVRCLQQAGLSGGEHRVHHGHLQTTRSEDPAQIPAPVPGGRPQKDAGSGEKPA